MLCKRRRRNIFQLKNCPPKDNEDGAAKRQSDDEQERVVVDLVSSADNVTVLHKPVSSEPVDIDIPTDDEDSSHESSSYGM